MKFTEIRQSVANARNTLGDVIAKARYGKEFTILLNRDKPVAVVVSVEFYEQVKSLMRE